MKLLDFFKELIKFELFQMVAGITSLWSISIIYIGFFL